MDRPRAEAPVPVLERRRTGGLRPRYRRGGGGAAIPDPQLCLGFESVLATGRDRALIPHDDDLDVIVGFEPDAARTLADGLRLIEEHLRPLGFEVTGPFVAQRHVRRPGRKRVEVFVGIFEGEAISWYPGARGATHR
jgi:hypothetical protein